MKFVADLTKELDSDKANLAHMAIGVAGEACEVVELVKKHFAYGKELDTDLLIKELGDLLFYMQGLLNYTAPGVTMDIVMTHNRNKLTKRYPGGYSDAKALARADEVAPTGE
jgi:NTP pyrophosphatase (non-canonical NTP hydrolase)